MSEELPIGCRLKAHNFKHFLKAFDLMEDLVLNITEEGINAAGTSGRTFFTGRHFNYREGEESLGVGAVPIGQLATFVSLVNEVAPGNQEVEITLSDNTILVVSDDGSFRIPTIAMASSQAGVETVLNYLTDSEQNDWTNFGSGKLDYAVQFDGAIFRPLCNVGKAIKSGALYCLEINPTELVLSAQRDKIRLDKQIPHQTENSQWLPDDAVIAWFGPWLMDALKAMPSEGTVHVHGGHDAPLVIRHESPDGDWGTQAVIAPRQDAGGQAE